MSKQNRPAQHSQTWRQLNPVEPEKVSHLIYRALGEMLAFLPTVIAFFLIFSLLALYF